MIVQLTAVLPLTLSHSLTLSQTLSHSLTLSVTEYLTQITGDFCASIGIQFWAMFWASRSLDPHDLRLSSMNGQSC